MVHGDKCPVCGSKDVGDDSFHYTYDKNSKVCAGWDCYDCGSSYSVIYKAEKFIVEKFIPGEDNWEDEYEELI